MKVAVAVTFPRKQYVKLQIEYNTLMVGVIYTNRDISFSMSSCPARTSRMAPATSMIYDINTDQLQSANP